MVVVVGGSSRSLGVTLQKEISAEFSGIETVVLETSVLNGRSKTAIWLPPFLKRECINLLCLPLHRSCSCARGLTHPGGEAAAAAEVSPGQRGSGAGDQRALEETPGVP